MNISFVLSNSVLVYLLLLSTSIQHGTAEERDPIKAGVLVIQKEKRLKAVPTKTELTKVWSYNTKVSSQSFLEKRFGTKELLYLNISKTSFDLVIVKGKIQPLLINSDPHEIWELNGLQKDFSMIKGIHPSSHSVELVIPGGDMRGFWKIDLNKKLKLSYREEYDGF